MTPEISIILPSIRHENIKAVVASLNMSTRRSYELIIIGPPFKQDIDLTNIKLITDYGSPVRASQIGACLAEGKIITWFSDDGIYYPNRMDETIDALYSMPAEYGDKNVVITKYVEGKNGTNKNQLDDNYFYINTHPAIRCNVPNHFRIFNMAFMYRSYFESLGGWDCSYESCASAHNDLAIKAQFDGANVALYPYNLFDSDHGQSDHGPIEEGQHHYDEPLFVSRYRRQPVLINKVTMDNWKNAPRVWTRRFK